MTKNKILSIAKCLFALFLAVLTFVHFISGDGLNPWGESTIVIAFQITISFVWFILGAFLLCWSLAMSLTLIDGIKK